MPLDKVSLADILGNVPFGLTVGTESGETVYANTLGERFALPGARDTMAPDGRVFRSRSFAIGHDGEAYEARLALDVTEQYDLENDLFRRAFFDELTGLPNRSLIEKSVASQIETDDGSGFALAFIDLDGFKQVNDYYGHAVGDQLLTRIAERISTKLRPTDMLARIGGDEFVLLLSPITDLEVASHVGHILERLKEPFHIDGCEILSSASVGISLYPSDGATYDTLRVNADSAMYHIKSDRKGSLGFFDPGIGRESAKKMRVEQQLRLAVRDGRLCCAYQPKVDFRSNEIAGVEVLLRWRDEDGVVRAPGDFINLAGEIGLIESISHVVLAEVTRSIDEINAAFGREATISINVAAKLAGEFRFMRSFIDALVATGYTKRFMLEITEEAFIAKDGFQNRILPMIREAGARVSIDDFGAGYSSLSALCDITADELKVDRSFVTEIHRRPRSQSVLNAIETLGRALGMGIVVEGVETFEELAYLQAATHVRCGQGYYFSKPLLLGDFGGLASALASRAPPSSRIVPLERGRRARA